MGGVDALLCGMAGGRFRNRRAAGLHYDRLSHAVMHALCCSVRSAYSARGESARGDLSFRGDDWVESHMGGSPPQKEDFS
jgi:hypothetical protein